MRFTTFVLMLLAATAATTGAETKRTPPSLLEARLESSRWNLAMAGGIAACEAALDEKGAVTSVAMVQDVPPHGAALAEAVRSWRFEPAREGARSVPSRVLVLGFFRPPGINFPAPASPRYKTTTAPDEIPWPTSVAVPPYPPNALGSGGVLLEADVSEAGSVVGTRRLTPAGAFDSAAEQALKAWRFRPAKDGAGEVASRVFVVLTFVGTTP